MANSTDPKQKQYLDLARMVVARAQTRMEVVRHSEWRAYGACAIALNNLFNLDHDNDEVFAVGRFHIKDGALNQRNEINGLFVGNHVLGFGEQEGWRAILYAALDDDRAEAALNQNDIISRADTNEVLWTSGFAGTQVFNLANELQAFVDEQRMQQQTAPSSGAGRGQRL